VELTSAEVEKHVGKRAMRRVRWYGVDDPVVQGNTLRGRVAGFDVQAELTTPLTSRCTCLYRTACDHVAVLLQAWVTDPHQFRRDQAESIDLPETAFPLLRWLESHDPELLEHPIAEVLAHGHFLPNSHPLWRWMNSSASLRETLEGLTDPSLASSGAGVTDQEAVRPVVQELTPRVRRRHSHRVALERAASWRDEPPDEPVLVPLWEAANAALTDADRQRTPGSHGSVTLDAGGDQLVFRLNCLPTRGIQRPITPDLLDGLGAFTRSELAGVVLDSVIGPLAPTVREVVVDTLKIPRWQRALARLDTALAMEGGLDTDARLAAATGWKIEVKTGDGEGMSGRIDKVVPVRLTPYKSRAGFRTKKLTGHALADLPRPADRAAHAALRTSAGVPFVLEHLVDHPRVVGSDGMLVRVRRAQLEVAVRERQGLVVELLLDGDPLEEELLAALEPIGGRVAVMVASTAMVIEIGPVLDGLIDVLKRYGTRFPKAARKALMQRLGLLEQRVPLRLDGEMRGAEEPVDWRPVLRLVPLSDGALRVTVRLRPLSGGPLFAPGNGPMEVARVEAGARRFAARTLRKEPAETHRRLAELPLPVLTEWEGTLDDPDEALDLVHALQLAHRAGDVVVEWPDRVWKVDAEVAGAKGVRIRVNRRLDWFGADGGVQVGDTVIPLAQLLAAIRDQRRYVKLDDRGWVKLTVGLQEALRTAASVATDEEEPRLPALAAARAMLALEAAGGRVELPEDLMDHEARIRASDDLEPSVPDGLKATLRPYQLDGLTWLRRMACWAPGAVLADDMGLGKTVQALAFLLERGGGPALVVAPASVNVNWMREAARFVPSIPFAMYRGSGREAVLEELVSRGHGAIVTSYELLHRDRNALSEVAFDLVIFDEAQALKNALAKRSKAARALDTRFAVALSGTPIENDVLELWSLLRVVAPGLLGPRQHFMTRFGATGAKGEPYARGQLGKLIRPFILRRTKKAVAPELPEREESIDWVELSGPERVVYERIRNAAVAAIAKEQPKKPSNTGGARMAVLAALTRLRQAACAARLVDETVEGDSAKIARLCERIQAVCEAGEQALVFSQFTSLLDLAQEALGRRGVRMRRLDGSTPLKRRQAAVDAFQNGEADVFLISLKAGGTGLNLTAATTVIHLDPWWNPAAEDQASDRAHRIGQTQTVQVVRLVAVNTVEEEVLRLHAEKRELAERVLDGTEATDRLKAADLIALLEAGD
jgi:superfamily II DNA or RNA helicase